MKLFSRVSLAVAIALSGCKPETVQINYLDQAAPGSTAEPFAPAILGTDANEHSAVAFSPDGTVVLWAVMDNRYRGRIYEMNYTNGMWSKPVSPAFADTTSDDYSPSFSVDGRTLFFGSRRKAPAGYREGSGNRIWSVERTAHGWGIPQPVDTVVSKAQEFGHSVAKNGNLYVASTTGGPDLTIRFSEFVQGTFREPADLPGSINTGGYEDNPYVAPDESYLIFESNREAADGSLDLYISFRGADGAWSKPVNMGPKINTPFYERFARVSPDGRFLFFASDRDRRPGKAGYDMYWIDANVIEELRDR